MEGSIFSRFCADVFYGNYGQLFSNFKIRSLVVSDLLKLLLMAAVIL